MIGQLLEKIEKNIDTACQQVKRKSSDITLLGVAKGQPLEKIQAGIQAGLLEIGENYAQEMLKHVEALGDNSKIRWHFIGHLQRKKVRQIINKVSLIHSVDSLTLAQEINKRAAIISKVQPILIEVNLGDEENKSGVTIGKNLEELILQLPNLPNIDFQGLMTIPPYSENPEPTRPYFQQLRKIRDEINEKGLYRRTVGERHAVPLHHLSMGMTSDYEVAIEEGATIVRIGTGIFGARTPTRPDKKP